MRIHRLWLHDFRSYRELELTFDEGLNLIIGDNGNGKTNLVEAVAYLSRLNSFRGAPSSALVRAGSTSAFVRAEVESDGREVLIEAEISPTGRNTVLLNKQKLGRAKDLLGSLNVTVFAPDDLELIKGSPGIRRDFLDQTLVAVHPKNDQARTDYEKNLKQRNALLKQMGGRTDDASLVTLDVWDERIVETGERLANLRSKLCERLSPLLTDAYQTISGQRGEVVLTYDAEWSQDGLRAALERSRAQDIRRGLTLVGPHRDEVVIELDEMPARTHGSQGEQRCLALGLRLGSHRLVLEATKTAPVLLLDDVFSELDHKRSLALTESLPPGQTLVTTATEIPSLSTPQKLIRIRHSEVA